MIVSVGTSGLRSHGHISAGVGWARAWRMHLQEAHGCPQNFNADATQARAQKCRRGAGVGFFIMLQALPGVGAGSDLRACTTKCLQEIQLRHLFIKASKKNRTFFIFFI